MSDKLPPKILVIEPDEVLNANLCNTIERYLFDVNRVTNSEAAVRSGEVDPPNVAIISSRIQDKSATELIAQLRKVKGLEKLPALFLIEENEQAEIYKPAVGIYSETLHRPFTLNELMTTIRLLLRKSKPVFRDKIIKYDDISMDLSTFKVYRVNKQMYLGPTEFKILQLFVQKPKNIYSRRQIIDYIWGVDKKISQRTVDVHINRIRALMTLETDQYQLIKTIRLFGYCLD